MDVKGKTVIITGSASGLGKSMALGFAKLGANVIVSDIRQESIDAVVDEIKSAGGNAFGIPGDVSNENDATNLMAEAVSKTGSLDVAILNAGILRDGLLVKVDKETGNVKGKMSLDQWQAVINVNLTGVFLTGREAAVQMINSKKGGVIIPISSVAMHGNPGQSNYSAAKAGVAGIAPGFIATEMVLKDMNPAALDKWKALIPIGRLGEPDEIFRTAQFIVENDLIDGVVIEASGGIKI